MKNKIYFGILIEYISLFLLLYFGTKIPILGVISNFCLLIGFIMVYCGLEDIEEKFNDLEEKLKKYLTNKK